MSILAAERQQQILEQLGRDGRVLATSLAEGFAASEDTIRRDLRDLAGRGLCRRVYGGALPVSPASSSAQVRASEATDRKAALGKALAALVAPNALVFIDSGSTNLAAVKAFPDDLRLTVATHDPAIAAALLAKPQITLWLIGGRVSRETGAAYGGRTLADVEALRPELALLGVCALDPWEESPRLTRRTPRSNEPFCTTPAGSLPRSSTKSSKPAPRLPSVGLKALRAWFSKPTRQRLSYAHSRSTGSRFSARILLKPISCKPRISPFSVQAGQTQMIEARLELAPDKAEAPPWPQRLGTLSVFLANGLGIGAWAAAIPRIKADLALSDAGLSFALLAFAAGGIVAMPLTGLLAHRFRSGLASIVSGFAFAAAIAGDWVRLFARNLVCDGVSRGNNEWRHGRRHERQCKRRRTALRHAAHVLVSRRVQSRGRRGRSVGRLAWRERNRFGSRRPSFALVVARRACSPVPHA